MTEYEELMDILLRLPPEMQDAIKDLADERARQYCNKYDNHLQDFKNAAYRYELSKRTCDVVYQSISCWNLNAGTLEGFRAIHEIKDYFTKKFDWVLNDYIRTRYIDTGFLRALPHETIT